MIEYIPPQNELILCSLFMFSDLMTAFTNSSLEIQMTTITVPQEVMVMVMAVGMDMAMGSGHQRTLNGVRFQR